MVVNPFQLWNDRGHPYPSLAYITLGVPKHVVSAIFIEFESDPNANALSIRPTEFVTDEIRTYNFRIMQLMLG